MQFNQNGEIESEGAVKVKGVNAEDIEDNIPAIQNKFKEIIGNNKSLNSLLNGLSADDFKKEYRELLKSKYKLSDKFAQEIIKNSTWIDGNTDFEMPVLEITDEEVNEEFLRKKQKEGILLAAPWIEVRDGVQLGIKPKKEFEEGSAKQREIIMKALQKIQGINGEDLVPGGSTTIDISLLKKNDTLKHFLNLLKANRDEIKNSQVVYFGDEFREKISGYPGHDSAIAMAAQAGGLEGIRVVSVDRKAPSDNIKDVVNWIGNGPGQTLDIINSVFEDETIWEKRVEISNYLEENARSILVDNSGVINLKDLSRETDIRISELKKILRTETFSGNSDYLYPGIIGSVFGKVLSEDNLAQDPELKLLLQDKIEKALIAQGVPSEELREKVVDIYREKLKKGFREFEFFDVLSDPEALQNLSFGFLKKVVNKDRIKYATTVHLDGDWHVNAHVMVVDKEGNMLVQVKEKKKDGEIKTPFDLSASGHISAGETVTEGAIREMMEEIAGLTNFSPNRLIKVGIYKKISGQGTTEGGYKGTKTRGVFQGKSSEVYNREVSGFFVYKADELKEVNGQVIAVINDRKYQLAPGESEKLVVKHLDDLLSDYVTKKSQPDIKIDDFFRSAFRQYFEVPGLIEDVLSKVRK